MVTNAHAEFTNENFYINQFQREHISTEEKLPIFHSIMFLRLTKNSFLELEQKLQHFCCCLVLSIFIYPALNQLPKFFVIIRDTLTKIQKL